MQITLLFLMPFQQQVLFLQKFSNLNILWIPDHFSLREVGDDGDTLTSHALVHKSTNPKELVPEASVTTRPQGCESPRI